MSPCTNPDLTLRHCCLHWQHGGICHRAWCHSTQEWLCEAGWCSSSQLEQGQYGRIDLVGCCRGDSAVGLWKPLPARSFVHSAASVPPGTPLHPIDPHHPLPSGDARAPSLSGNPSSLRPLGMPRVPVIRAGPRGDSGRARGRAGPGLPGTGGRDAPCRLRPGTAPGQDHRDGIHRAGSACPGWKQL